MRSQISEAVKDGQIKIDQVGSMASGLQRIQDEEIELGSPTSQVYGGDGGDRPSVSQNEKANRPMTDTF